jgi:hypothetical protein
MVDLRTRQHLHTTVRALNCAVQVTGERRECVCPIKLSSDMSAAHIPRHFRWMSEGLRREARNRKPLVDDSHVAVITSATVKPTPTESCVFETWVGTPRHRMRQVQQRWKSSRTQQVDPYHQYDP